MSRLRPLPYRQPTRDLNRKACSLPHATHSRLLSARGAARHALTTLTVCATTTGLNFANNARSHIFAELTVFAPRPAARTISAPAWLDAYHWEIVHARRC